MAFGLLKDKTATIEKLEFASVIMCPLLRFLCMMNSNVERDKSALLIIDMQYDFANPGGQAYVDGMEEIIPRLASSASIFRNRGKPVFLNGSNLAFYHRMQFS